MTLSSELTVSWPLPPRPAPAPLQVVAGGLVLHFAPLPLTPTDTPESVAAAAKIPPQSVTEYRKKSHPDDIQKMSRVFHATFLLMPVGGEEGARDGGVKVSATHKIESAGWILGAEKSCEHGWRRSSPSSLTSLQSRSYARHTHVLTRSQLVPLTSAVLRRKRNVPLRRLIKAATRP